MSMTREQAAAAVKKYGSQQKAGDALGVSKSTVWKALRLAPGGKSKAPTAKVVEAAPKKSGRALGDFRAAYDKDFIVPRKIKDGLKALGGGWEYEVSFSKMCGVSLADMGNYRSQFSDYVVDIRRESKRAWAGTVGGAKQMRAML